MEDARAALDLALLKFERGPSYAAGTGERGDRLLDVLGAAGRCVLICPCCVVLCCAVLCCGPRPWLLVVHDCTVLGVRCIVRAEQHDH